MKQDWSDIYIIIGDRIRLLRMERDWSLEDLARECGLGVSRQTIANMENGKQNMDIHQLWCLASTFGVQPSALLDIEDSKSVIEMKKAIFENRVKELKRELGL